MEKTRFCSFVFVFSIRKTKQQVSDSFFWFENEIADIGLSNRFKNETKRKFPFISKMKRNDNKKIKTCPTLNVESFYKYEYAYSKV